MRKYRVKRKKYPTYIRYGSKMKIKLSYLYQIWEWDENKTILLISDMGVKNTVLPISDMGVCVGRLGQ